MDTFAWIPDSGAGEKAAPRLLSAQFGEGYNQSAPDGLNFDMRPRNLSFSDRSISEATAIDVFLSGKNGCTTFLYTHATTGVTKKYRCQDWNVVDSGNLRTITATFVQVPA